MAFLATPAIVSGQQIVEVDYSTGRTIIDDEWQLNCVAPHSRFQYSAPHFHRSRRHQKTCDLCLGK